MQRWALVTMNHRGRIDDGKDFWINESNVASMMELDDGCMVNFATSEYDVIKVRQSCDCIFTEGDNWQATQEGSD